MMLIGSTVTYGQSSPPTSKLQLFSNVNGASDTVPSGKTKMKVAMNAMVVGLHFEDGAWAFRQEVQFGSYLTNHFSWLIGIGHNESHADFKTVSQSGSSTTKEMKTTSLTFPLTLNYTLGNPSKMMNLKLQGGVTYSYVLSMKIGSDKQNLSGISRGGFYAHLRMILMDFVFAEYDIPFKGGDGAFLFGISIAI